MRKEYYISTIDILSYRPVIAEQAKLELIRVRHQDAPIEGAIILKVKKGWRLNEIPAVKDKGFKYIFEKIDD